MAYDDGGVLPGFSSVAVGIRDAEERLVASISAIEPSLRLTQAVRKEITPDVKSYAMEISVDIGYREKKG